MIQIQADQLLNQTHTHTVREKGILSNNIKLKLRMWVREDEYKSWAVEQFKRGIKKLLATESLDKHGVRNTYPTGTVPMGSNVNRRGDKGSFTLCLFKWL